ncbi:MAG TPA: GvpL/GvpF family gas vesicle protein [Thermoanaerobaculia bacterium]|nr:GvpL/GvpF family gas vesicle protein [Thermoanaerobaculia bacterium]
MPNVIYLYAIAPRGALVAPDLEGVDGRHDFVVIEEGEVAALAGRVDAEEFSQEAIDARASDLDWIGQIGWRHQQVVAAAREQADAIPLGAFSLFSSEDALRAHLRDRHAALRGVLETIRGREEWTLQVDFEGDKWEAAVARRSPTLAALAAETEGAPAGKAYLLRRKADEAKKNAAREARDAVVRELESRVSEALRAPVIVELRPRPGGTVPQINILLEKKRSPEIGALAGRLETEYAPDGVELRVTGPWPPYTFVSRPA